MALDKSRTSPFMKGVIIFVALTFALSIVATGLIGVLGTGGGGSATPATPSSTDTTATLNAIALTHTPVIQATEASLTAAPKNYALLVQQAQQYYDWAAQVRQTISGSPNNSGQDQPIWRSAVPYYRRALMIKKTDPAVGTDYSVTLFYSGDTTQAITVAKSVVAANPTFSPVLYNLGIFYLATNDTVNAKATLQAYLKLDPNGTNAANAKAELTKLP